MKDAEVGELEQATLPRVDEKALLDDSIKMEGSRSHAEKFLEAFDVADNLAVVVGDNDAEYISAQITEKVVRHLGDQRKGGKMRIHGYATAKGTDHPPLIAFLDDGPINQLKTVFHCDFQPCVTKFQTVGYSNSFKHAGSLSQIPTMNLRLRVSDGWAVFPDRRLEFRLDGLPQCLGYDERTKHENGLLRVAEIETRIPRLVDVDEVHGG